MLVLFCFFIAQNIYFAIIETIGSKINKELISTVRLMANRQITIIIANEDERSFVIDFVDYES
jgi:low affinity Fe/Cu permease